MNSLLVLKIFAVLTNLQVLPRPSLETKHFCPWCGGNADALQYSQQRNLWYYNNVAHDKTTGANTVFAVNYGAAGLHWDATIGKWIGNRFVNTYVCGDLPKTPPLIDPTEGYCYWKGCCYAGPFLDGSGHFDVRYLQCSTRRLNWNCR